MEATLEKPVTALKAILAANQVNQLLTMIPNGVKTISFDCFDTLIWRKAVDPIDVFYTLAKHPIASQHGLTFSLRIMSERLAYQFNLVSKQHTQASLNDIYSHAFPYLSAQDIQLLCEAEIECELRHCFAYQPIVEAISSLHSNGYKIIIVSDTYLTENELRTILKNKLPAQAYQCIDKVYCSSDYQTAKYENLFTKVLTNENISAYKVLHIGDNIKADVNKPHSFGIHTLHFHQYNSEIAEVLRMQSLSSCFVDTTIRGEKSLTAPFKALLAASTVPEKTPEQIGYHTVGPILFAYANYIQESYQALVKQNKKVKIAYLLRDGYLPYLACKAVDETLPGNPVRISRFSAFASSFTDSASIDHYLASRIISRRYKEFCKQFLLPTDLAHKIISQAEKSDTPTLTFCKLIHQPDVEKQIFAASKKYRERLFKYLQKEMGLEKGDTLMFVDLGYTGTTQKRLSTVFKEEYQIDIAGRYLISVNAGHSSHGALDREGLLDKKHYDDKSLGMLITYIALFEQICTSTEKSTIDFDDEGNPIYAEASVEENQLSKIVPIHRGTLNFIADAKEYMAKHPEHMSAADYRDLAAINLARLIYLPTKFENQYFSEFNHDVNLGADDVLKIMDINRSLDSLKRRGWLHSLHESYEQIRMNYPSEWRAISLELSVLLMTQHRFDFKIADNDLSHQSISIPVLIQTTQESSLIQMDAYPSYNGYYSLQVPVPENGKIGIQFGAAVPCVEIYKIEKFPLIYLNRREETDHTEEVSDELLLSEMKLLHATVLLAESEQGLLIFSPKKTDASQMILRVIFRPI